MKGTVKPLFRDPLQMPKVAYKQMSTVLHTNGESTNVAVESTVEAWAGEKMVGFTAADIRGREHGSPLAVAVQFWYPNPDGGRKKDAKNWTQHLSLAIAVGWRRAALEGCDAVVDELLFPRPTSHGKAHYTRMH